MKKGKSSILIIYTGGTIGMKSDPTDNTLKPFNFRQILDEVPREVCLPDRLIFLQPDNRFF